MTWRSSRGTLVFANRGTWLPVMLSSVAASAGLQRLPMPAETASRASWEKSCMRDADITYRIVTELLDYIRSENLGNWQPTGAGMAYATWRHRFLRHKVLVHAEETALEAERAAMHTGRAEAWRHGVLNRGIWTEVDMRDAYIRIAAECSMPVKLKYNTGRLSNEQYATLRRDYRVLGKCMVANTVPVVRAHVGGRTLWPVATSETTLWRPELNLAMEEGASVRILDSWCYTRAPVLKEWAEWVLSITRRADDEISPVVRTWVKHCGRAFIGRLALRAPTWEPNGGNPSG